MKRNIFILCALTLLIGISCTQKESSNTTDKINSSGDISESKSAPKIDYYTCSMHPQVHQDHPGTCPICGMTLVPVYKKDSGAQLIIPKNEGVINAAPTVSISTEKQQAIGVKKSVVEKKDISYPLTLNARVAFDPDLYVAQKEYIEIIKSVPSLKTSARQRLKLLGMSEEEILSLEKQRGTPSDLISPQNGYWTYATLYPNDLALVQKGMPVSVLGDTGYVDGIDPVLDPMTQSARARIFVKSKTIPKPNTFVTATLQIPLHDVLVIPSSALIDTGNRKIVYVVTEDTQFQMREVQTSFSSNDFSIITQGLKEGDTVVSSAAFLIDSESQLIGRL